MPTVTHHEENRREDIERYLQEEIEKARASATPISRVTLARLVQNQFRLNHREAETLVGQYCDETSPAVPEYLSSEFGRPYLKVLAVLNVVIGIAFLVFAVRYLQQNRPAWPGFVAGTVFVGLSALSWVKSFETTEASKSRRRIRA